MAVNIEEQGRKFITTEPIEKSDESGSQAVWESVRNAFAENTCIGYWRYPIFLKVGEIRKEPDILIVDRELGIITIAIFSVKIDQIAAIKDNNWELKNFSGHPGNPYEQAETQLYAILGYCDREPAIRRKVSGKTIIALPLITSKEWQQKGFDKVPNCPSIIFKDQLAKASLMETIHKAAAIVSGERLDDKQWEILLTVISGTSVLRQTPRLITDGNNKNRSNAIAILRTL